MNTWKYQGPEITDQDIEIVEKNLSVRLPYDYLECVRSHNGARPTPNVLDIPGRPQAVFHQLLRLDGRGGDSVIGVKSMLQDRLGEGCVPFAKDPFGNLFCFHFTSPRKPSVVFWNHETGVTVKICSTFTEILKMLYSPDNE